MPRKFRDTVTKGTVREKQKNGSIYVYEREYKYDPETKKNKRVANHLIGKILPGSDEMIPTREKKPDGQGPMALLAAAKKQNAQSQNAQEADASRTRQNLSDILSWAGEASGIDEDLARTMDKGDAEKTASFARFLTATGGDTTPGIENFQLEHPLPYAGVMDADVCYNLFRELGEDETIRQVFFMNRAARLGTHPLLALDSTGVATYSDNQLEARYGYGSKDDGLKRIRYSVIYAVETLQPIAFVKRPGNIPDSQTLQNAIDQLVMLGIKDPQLVTDNGYWSEENIGYMLFQGVDFITRAETNIKWVSGCVDDAIGTIHTIDCLDPEGSGTYVKSYKVKHAFPKIRKYASTKKGLAAGDSEPVERSVWVYVCFDPIRKENEDRKFYEDLIELRRQLLEEGIPLEAMTEAASAKAAKYLVITSGPNGEIQAIDWNKKNVEAHCRHHGFFVLVANKEKDKFAALHKYRMREYVEGYFERGNNEADAKRPRVWSANELMGRMMAQFVGLCYGDFLRYRIGLVKKQLEDEIAAAKQAGAPASQTEDDAKLLNWMKSTSFLNILRWFDAYENFAVSTEVRSRRWNAATTKRDRRFCELLMSEPDS